MFPRPVLSNFTDEGKVQLSNLIHPTPKCSRIIVRNLELISLEIIHSLPPFCFLVISRKDFPFQLVGQLSIEQGLPEVRVGLLGYLQNHSCVI